MPADSAPAGPPGWAGPWRRLPPPERSRAALRRAEVGPELEEVRQRRGCPGVKFGARREEPGSRLEEPNWRRAVRHESWIGRGGREDACQNDVGREPRDRCEIPRVPLPAHD